ncbi:helix-turn-helix domain-containing protein [Chondromyces apiculatus]|uniref:helix-turn-helix domain-containing protein n=1 Tax=Chondromyces apiculatus TaxID=51 RepID=UPI0018CC620D|nr:AraC family transcriptional regulator [Chondromyces apiculatus]
MNTSPGETVARFPHNIEAVQTRSRTWNGITVHAITFQIRPGEAWSLLASDQTCLSAVIETRGGPVEPRLKIGQSLPAHHDGPWPMSFIPAGMTLWGYTGGSHIVREARLNFDLVALGEKLGEYLDLSQLQVPLPLFHDNRIWQLCALLAQQCEAPDPLSQLYGDSLTVALVVDLLRFGKIPPRTSGRGGLARWQLRRVTDYMREHLSAAIQLAELAAMTGLSQSQFGRAFKASTGLPPHRWQVNERVQKAQQLLLSSPMSLAEVALVTGFAEQSHFTRVFRQLVGTSPGAWRRDHRA